MKLELGRVEIGNEHGVVEQEDGRIWSWKRSLDSISMEFFSLFSIGLTLEVIAPFLITLMELSSLEGTSVVRLFLLSISSVVQVVAWSCLGEDLRHGGMNEKGCRGSKELWNRLETSWKWLDDMEGSWSWSFFIFFSYTI